jgi:ParB/RepB/Spo0J family partition protein
MKTEQKNNSAKAGAQNQAAAISVLKDNFIMASPSLLVADEKVNPRFEYGDIEELMKSIIENGIRNPLKGYRKGDKIVLKDGHRRMRAVNLAIEKGHKIERVPVVLEQATLNDEERTLEFLIYNDGKPLTMLEQSEVIRRLLNFGWKVTDIVKKTAKARGYIDNLITLTKVPMKVHNLIIEDKISAHAVIQIAAAVKGDDAKLITEVENAVKAAKESGKEKATPKHVGTKQVKSQSYGKFYKWTEEIADFLAGRKDTIRERGEVLDKIMIAFENGQSAKQFAEGYFLDKTKKPAVPAVKAAPAKKAAKKK